MGQEKCRCLATKRVLDGAARAHFRGWDGVPKCACGQAPDEQEHWLTDCSEQKKIREEWEAEAVAQVGDWIKRLSSNELQLLMAGRMPKRVRTLMRYKGKFEPGETLGQALIRLQAVMVKWGVKATEARAEKGDLGLGTGKMGGKRCQKCGGEKMGGGDNVPL